MSFRPTAEVIALAALSMCAFDTSVRQTQIDMLVVCSVAAAALVLGARAIPWSSFPTHMRTVASGLVALLCVAWLVAAAVAMHAGDMRTCASASLALSIAAFSFTDPTVCATALSISGAVRAYAET